MAGYGLGIAGPLILISLGAGYIVCADAKKQQGTLKTVGYIIGTAIITLSIIAGLYKAYLLYSGSRWAKICPMIQTRPIHEPMIQKGQTMRPRTK